jgi:RNA polymerase sigma factor (sigma-70 family)
MMIAVDVTDRPTGGEVEAWYRAHHLELVRLAALAVGDRGRAEDVVHDVFASCQRRPPQLRDPQRPLPYLRSAVLNRCRSSLLRRATGRLATERAAARTRPRDASAEDDAVAATTRAGVLAAVRSLPRLQRDVVLLRYWLDLSEREIAATLGVSAGTVKSSAHRAMRTLAPLLEALR